jgi:hypothetical protein
MMSPLPEIDFRQFYDGFNASITSIDCGMMCAPHSPNHKPFCCDTCFAVPAVYRQEWAYLEKSTDLWHVWRGDECTTAPVDMAGMAAGMPKNMLLLACLGPHLCQRPYRSVSCRQFPFFPFVTSDYRFIGMAYDWEFEPTCWVISHLERVTPEYQSEAIAAHDKLFELWPDEMESYAARSEAMRFHFAALKRRIPILYRGGGLRMLSPHSQQLSKPGPRALRRFGPYAEER